MGDDDGSAAMGDAFWRFSLAFYRRDGVASACLRLQDEGGWDVNLVLFCLWTGFARGAASPSALQAVLDLSAAWREAAVAPIRAVRRRLKTGLTATGAARLEIETFREKVKRLELEAEERQQRALAPFAATAASPAGRGAATALIQRSAALLGQETDPLTGDFSEIWSALLNEAEDLIAERDDF